MTKLKTKNKRKAAHRTALLKRLKQQNEYFGKKSGTRETMVSGARNCGKMCKVYLDFGHESSLWIDEMKSPENEAVFRKAHLNGCWDNPEPKPRHHIKCISKPVQFEWILGQ